MKTIAYVVALTALATTLHADDGLIDVVTPPGGASNSGVSILLGRGDGTFGAATRYTFGNSTGHAEVVDVNHDGAPDILTRT